MCLPDNRLWLWQQLSQWEEERQKAKEENCTGEKGEETEGKVEASEASAEE